MIDAVLVSLSVIIIFVATATMLRPWHLHDLSTPPPAPAPVWLSFGGLVATLALLVRWIITGKPLVSILFVGVSVVSMIFTCRFAVRAEAQHKEAVTKWDELRRIGE